MSFEFTVLPDERFIEILDAWVDSRWCQWVVAMSWLNASVGVR